MSVELLDDPNGQWFKGKTLLKLSFLDQCHILENIQFHNIGIKTSPEKLLLAYDRNKGRKKTKRGNEYFSLQRIPIWLLGPTLPWAVAGTNPLVPYPTSRPVMLQLSTRMVKTSHMTTNIQLECIITA